MDKKTKINKITDKLQREKEFLLDQVLEKDKLIEEQFNLYSKLYPEFFDSKTSKDFVLYNRFPSFKEVQAYHSKLPSLSHPLSDYGNFDIRELAEVIKLLYSFQRQREYKVLTFGSLDVDVNGVYYKHVIPNISFSIGNDNNLEDYKHFQQFFIEGDSKFKFNSSIKENLIYLNAKQADNYLKNQILEISCFVPGVYGLEYEINYYDYLKKLYKSSYFLKDINIFAEDVCQNFHGYRGIKDTLNFPMHVNDSFIAKALISIAIYKRNNKKFLLSNDDYKYIFYEIFKENVDLKQEIDKDIPKVLRYVPKSQLRKK